jgi:hypothetical protein
VGAPIFPGGELPIGERRAARFPAPIRVATDVDGRVGCEHGPRREMMIEPHPELYEHQLEGILLTTGGV